MIKAIRHTGLVVRDLKKSADFYQDILGFVPFKKATEEGSFIEKLVGIDKVKVSWVKLKAPDGSLLELLQYLSHPESAPVVNAPSNRLGCSHVAMTVKNIDALYRTLTDRGFHCHHAPQVSPDGLVKVMYCHDPDGIILELVEELS